MKERAKQFEDSGFGKIAAGVVLGLAIWGLIDGFVRFLFAPLVAAFIGDSRFELNSFTINTSEFRYGAFLESLFVVVAAVLVLSVVFPTLLRQLRGSSSRDVQLCPECREPIPIGARRCPHCTVPLEG